MLNLPVRPGVCDGCPVDLDVLFITKSNEFPTGELRAVVRNDGVRYSKAMDDVEEEQHGLLGFDHGYWSSFNPFCKLVYGDKQVGEAPGAFLSGPTRSSPQTTKGHVMGIIWRAWVGRCVCLVWGY